MTLKLTADDKLEHAFTNAGKDNCFRKINSVLVHPDGDWLYVASGTGTLTQCRIKANGETVITQVIRDEVAGPTRVGSAHSMELNENGQFLYVSAGRDGDHSAVGVWRVGEDGRLTNLQTILPGSDGVPDFKGGSDLVITPDGRSVFVCATGSRCLLEFTRNQQTGKLDFRQSIPIGRGKSVPAGIVVTPDGRFLYVAVNGNHALATIPLDPQPVP